MIMITDYGKEIYVFYVPLKHERNDRLLSEARRKLKGHVVCGKNKIKKSKLFFRF